MATSVQSGTSDAPTTYDETPYPSASFPQTHPNRVAAMGRLFGLNVPPPSSARILELGCADGANLLPMAVQAPDATFLGIDASKVQIAAGQKALAAAGLKNVELRCQNILDFPATGEKFDYIIVHGIFSWVPEPVRDKIMQICSAHLAENGIAYISYNALPGWNMRRSLRDMMLFHTQQFTDPATKVRQSRALLNFLAESVPTENNAYGLLLKSESEFMSKQLDNYLRHDILEEENTPFYLHEFVARAAKQGLQYLGEPGLSQMLAANFPEKVRDTLTRIGTNAIAQEQYMDFLRNRMFRQTLLCHASRSIQRQVKPESMATLAFQSLFKPLEGPVDLNPGVAFSFTGNTGLQITATDPFLKAALQTLVLSSPSVIAYGDLLRLAREASRPFLGAIPSNRDSIDELTLQRNLLNLYSKGFIEVYAEPIVCAQSVPEKPAVSPLARHHSLHARLITNRLHQGIPADVIARYVIEACDGSRARDEIVTAMIARVHEGKLNVKEGDRSVVSDERLRSLLAPEVDLVLAKLAKGGFFAS